MDHDLVSDPQKGEQWASSRAKVVAPWRAKLANFLSLMALGCFCTGPVIILFLYCYAWQLGLYPNPKAQPIAYRGVWSSRDELGRGVMLLFDPPVYAFILAFLSLLFKPTLRAWIVTGASILFLLLPVALIGLVED